MRRVVLVLMMCSLFLSGCIKVVYRVNEDGSGTLEYGLNVPAASLREMGSLDFSMSGEPPESDPQADFLVDLIDNPVTDAETGIIFSAEESLENGEMWTYVIVTVPNIESWALIEAASDRTFPQVEESEDALASQDDIQIPTITRDGDTLRVEVIVPPDPNATTSDQEDPFGAALSGIMQLSYEIQLPGTVTEHNGTIDSLTGNPVWLFNFESTEPLTIFAVSQVEE